ncbi:unnamed protein product [Trichobilharzia regenti]|nr:unnamed protein product [Trichobilharzia regenti]
MSFALLRKAFGIGKAIDEKEFDDFFKVFDGSDALNVGSSGQLLFTRVISDIDECNQAAMQPSVDNCFKNSPFSPRRFYRMLFEHWTQLSLLVETLTNECAVAVCNGTRSCWGTHNFVPEPHCTDVITKAFNNFLDYFRDLCLPKLSFPVWSTLNVTLSIGSDSLPSYFEPSRTDCVAYWLNMDPSYCQSLSADCSQASKDNLADIFVKSCLVPLIIKGNNRDHRK